MITKCIEEGKLRFYRLSNAHRSKIERNEALHRGQKLDAMFQNFLLQNFMKINAVNNLFVQVGILA